MSIDISRWTSRNLEEAMEELEILREVREFEENKDEDYRKTVFTNENLYMKKPTRRTAHQVGEIVISNRGQKMKMVGYRTVADIDVLFEDGTLVEHRQYHDFIRGKIKNPNYNGPIKRIEESFLGRTNIATNDQIMKIIKYKNCNDIDVEFEDGTIVKNVGLSAFKEGHIKNPNKPICRDYSETIKETEAKRIGETRTATNGQKMKIIAYRGAKDIDVEFEDGSVARNKMYSAFKSGRISNPNLRIPKRCSKDKYLGKTFTNTAGYKMTVIAYRNSYDIDVQFEDGTIVKTYTSCVKKGWVKKK